MKTSEQIKDYLKTYSVGCAEAQAEKNGLLTALKIAKAHEAEYGWQPIETAPKDRKNVVCEGDRTAIELVVWNDETNWWQDETNRVVDATEWYRFEEETK